MRPPLLNLSERTALAARLRHLKPGVAAAVTTEFLARHPDWVQKYGDRDRALGIEDAASHVEFLAGAIDCGSTSGFEDYLRWTTRMLGARGIGVEFVTENCQQIRAALAADLSASEQELVAQYIQEGCAAVTEPATADAATTNGTLVLTRELFLQAILTGQRHVALTIATEAVSAGQQIHDIYAEVFQEALYEVGRRWEANQITVAEEHMATAITQYVVAQMYSRLPTSPQQRGNLVMTGVEGELHQVGPTMVADVLEADGWNVRFLGSNMPHSGIAQAIEQHRAAVVGISATMLYNISQVVRLITGLREHLGDRMPQVLLGGRAFHAAPTLGTELGVVGVAHDVRAAVALARPLGPGSGLKITKRRM